MDDVASPVWDAAFGKRLKTQAAHSSRDEGLQYGG